MEETSAALSHFFPDGMADRMLHFLVKLPFGVCVSFLSPHHLIFTAPCAGTGPVLGSCHQIGEENPRPRKRSRIDHDLAKKDDAGKILYLAIPGSAHN